MSQAPKPKGNELIERLNGLDANARKNDLVMGGLRREARALRAVDPSMSYQLEGLIEFAAGNKRKASDLLDKAIDLDPNRYVVRSNYAAQLFNMGDPVRAYQQQEHAYRLTEGSPDDARDLCRMALFAGRISRANEVLELVKRLKSDVPEGLQKTLKTAGAVQAARGFSDERASAFLAPIYRFISDDDAIELDGMFVGATLDDEEGLLTVDFVLAQSFEETVAIQDRLIEMRLASDEPHDLACAFSVNVRAKG